MGGNDSCGLYSRVASIQENTLFLVEVVGAIMDFAILKSRFLISKNLGLSYCALIPLKISEIITGN